MVPAASFLDALQLAAARAEQAESDFRREIAQRTKALERERAFAHRRLNFMRAIAQAVASAENEEVAVAAASAAASAKLGWATESEARTDVLARLAPVARTVFVGLAPVADEDAPRPDVLGALATFEAWYRDTHPDAFWVLFEHYMPETPVVDF